MNPNAHNDMLDPQGRIVFIYVTAGDANNGTGSFGNGTIPYFQAREQGAINSARFASNMAIAGGTAGGGYTTRWVNGHYITCYEYKNTIHYFLRLPDVPVSNSVSGPTYLSYMWDYGWSLNSIDGANYYYDRNDVINTVRAIYASESAGITYRYSNRFDADYSGATGDHTDHRIAGRIAAAADGGLGLNVYGYRGYPATQNQSSEQNKLNEAASWVIAANTVAEAGYENTWADSWHQSFVQKCQFYQMTGYSRPATDAPQAAQLQPEAAKVSAVAAALAPPIAQLQAYPVPTADRLTLQVPAVEGSQAPELTLFDAQMRKLRNVKLAETAPQAGPGTYTVNVSDVPAGVYFVQVKAGGKTFQQKLMKAGR